MFRTFALLLLSTTAPLLAQVPTRSVSLNSPRSHVVDPARSVLYVTTSSGLQRYDLQSSTLLQPWLAGRSLRGIDITPDFASLLVCDDTTAGTEGFVHRIDIASGTVTTIPFTRESGEIGSWDIAVMGNGRAFVTTQFSGSAWVPLRELLLATNTLRIRPSHPGSGFNEVRQDTQLNRGAGRDLLLLLESNLSSGPAFTYDAQLDAFPAQRNFQTFHGGTIASVDRSGTRIALELGSSVQIVDRFLNDVTSLPNLLGGVIFDPTLDRLYGVDTAADLVRVFDTTTWAQTGSFPVGENVGTSHAQRDGEMSMAADGSYLVLSVPGGVRIFEVGLPAPVVTSVEPDAAHWDAGPVQVTVRGQFFRPGTTPEVLVGGVPATNATVVDPQTITCTFPGDEPGPKDVSVRFRFGPGVLASGFARTPALRLGGDPVPGGTAELTVQLRPGDYLGTFYALPPAGSTTLPWVQGTICLAPPTVWFQVPTWPLPRFQVATPIPNDPGFRGLRLLLQSLSSEAFSANGAVVSNCVELVVQ